MNLSDKEKRALEFLSKDESDLENSLQEYYHLNDTLIYLNETLRLEDVQIPVWQKYSETLLLKICLNSITLHGIASGFLLNSSYFEKELKGVKVVDSASSKTVLRSQLETFLMYHYIYVNPQREDEKQLRCLAWLYSSLMQRQNFPTNTEFGKKQKLNDQAAMEDLKSQIKSLASFSSLTPNQQKSLLDKGSGKLFTHWADILKETGFTETHGISLYYTYLCIYAHSEGLSAIQLNDSVFNYEKAKGDVILDIHYSKLLISLMIKAIVILFPQVEIKFKSLPDNLRYDIEIYCEHALSATA